MLINAVFAAIADSSERELRLALWWASVRDSGGSGVADTSASGGGGGGDSGSGSGGGDGCASTSSTTCEGVFVSNTARSLDTARSLESLTPVSARRFDTVK